MEEKDITNLILENEGLIYKIITKYRSYFELDDLYQVAVIGMIKAYKNYRDTYDTKFTSYAYPYVLGEVVKYVRSFRGIKVNNNMKNLYSRILKAKEILAQRLMKIPSIYELSLFLEMDESLISEVMLANQTVDSLDKMLGEDDKAFELYDHFGYCDSSIENYPLTSELEKLPPEERKIIEARYYDDMSQKEVGEVLGMYQVEVSRKERQILQKLKDKIAAW